MNWWPRLLATLLIGAVLDSGPVVARSLEQIRESGSLVLCAHPNSLPFASKTAATPGFQVELARALAVQLGVSLGQEWIVTPSQVFRSSCDIVLDVIGDQDAQSESGLQVSKPYYRGGVGLAVPRGSQVHGFADLDEHTKVGVQVGSTVAMLLNQLHIPISTFGVTAQVPPLGHSPRGNFDACGRVCSYPSAFSDPNSLTAPICSGYLGSDRSALKMT